MTPKQVLYSVSLWPEDLRAQWEERAAIMEFDGGEPRIVAERQAYEQFKQEAANGLV